jgi:hypothetical protein
VLAGLISVWFVLPLRQRGENDPDPRL